MPKQSFEERIIGLQSVKKALKSLKQTEIKNDPSLILRVADMALDVVGKGVGL